MKQFEIDADVQVNVRLSLDAELLKDVGYDLDEDSLYEFVASNILTDVRDLLDYEPSEPYIRNFIVLNHSK